MKKFWLDERFTKILEIVLSLFGIFLIYQILRKIFGGSWQAEDVILSLLVLNISCSFALAILFAQLKSDVNHLKGQYRRTHADMRAVQKDILSIQKDMSVMQKDIVSMQKDLKYLINKSDISEALLRGFSSS